MCIRGCKVYMPLHGHPYTCIRENHMYMHVLICIAVRTSGWVHAVRTHACALYPAALKELAPCSMLQQPTAPLACKELPQLWRELVQRVARRAHQLPACAPELNGTFHSSFATRPIASAPRKHRSASLYSPRQHPGDTPTPTIARVRTSMHVAPSRSARLQHRSQHPNQRRAPHPMHRHHFSNGG